MQKKETRNVFNIHCIVRCSVFGVFEVWRFGGFADVLQRRSGDRCTFSLQGRLHQGGWYKGRFWVVIFEAGDLDCQIYLTGNIAFFNVRIVFTKSFGD